MDHVADGPAVRAGLQAGDVIITQDGVPVAAVDDLHRALRGERAGRPVPIGLPRWAAQVTLTARPDEA